MRLHEINISPRSITIDGIPLLHSDAAPTVETLAPDLHLVHLTVYASRIQLDGDTHHNPEPTPIYDQLKGQKSQ